MKLSPDEATRQFVEALPALIADANPQSVSNILVCALSAREVTDNLLESLGMAGANDFILLQSALAQAQTAEEALQIWRYCLEWRDDLEDRMLASKRALELARTRNEVAAIFGDLIGVPSDFVDFMSAVHNNKNTAGYDLVEHLAGKKELVFAILCRFNDLPEELNQE